MAKSDKAHIPSLAEELGFSCRFHSGYYTLEKDGIIVRYSRSGGGQLELRLKGTVQRALLLSLAKQPNKVVAWLRNLDKAIACDVVRDAHRRALKYAQNQVSSCVRDIEELENDILIWSERDWNVKGLRAKKPVLKDRVSAALAAHRGCCLDNEEESNRVLSAVMEAVQQEPI